MTDKIDILLFNETPELSVFLTLKDWADDEVRIWYRSEKYGYERPKIAGKYLVNEDIMSYLPWDGSAVSYEEFESWHEKVREVVEFVYGRNMTEKQKAKCRTARYWNLHFVDEVLAEMKMKKDVRRMRRKTRRARRGTGEQRNHDSRT